MTLLLVALASPATAHADPFFKLVRYACDGAMDAIVIEYLGTFAADSAMPNPLMVSGEGNAWDPWDLVTTDREHGMVTELRSVERRCRLGDGEYQVTITPKPGNRNLNGNCGAWVTAAVRIVRDGQELASLQFEKSCNHPDHPIVARVLLQAGSDAAEIVHVSGDEFYR